MSGLFFNLNVYRRMGGRVTYPQLDVLLRTKIVSDPNYSHITIPAF